MEQNPKQPQVEEQNILRDIMLNLKKSIILVLVLVILSLCVGIVYAKLRKPEYIAEEQVLLSMGDGTHITSEINTMYAYKDTVVDFSDNGVVIDRANFYYEYYTQAKTGTDYTLDEFIHDVIFTEEMIKSCSEEKAILNEKKTKEESLVGLDYNRYETLWKTTQSEIENLRQQAVLMEKIRELQEDINGLLKETEQNPILIEAKQEELVKYKALLVKAKQGGNTGVSGKTVDVNVLDEYIRFYKTEKPWYYVAEEYITTASDQKGILPKNIGVVEYNADEEYEAFVFGLTYKDNTMEDAIEKIRILVLAFDIESLNFFDDMDTRITDLGTNSCSVDMTTSRIILISALIGVVLAVLVVYIRLLMDKTVKTKSEAEKLTGASVISCITKGEE